MKYKLTAKDCTAFQSLTRISFSPGNAHNQNKQRDRLQSCSTFRLTAILLFLNAIQLKRSGVGIQTQCDSTGEEDFSNNLLSWREKAV